MKINRSDFRGCMIGSAIGDALSYSRRNSISANAALSDGDEDGIPLKITELELNPESGKALVSDDTQLSVFTADGLLVADYKAKKKGNYSYIPCIFLSYEKWLYTQTGSFADDSYEYLKTSEILTWEVLYARRATHKRVLDALNGSIKGKYGKLKNRINNNDAYGSIPRVAPIGMYFVNDTKSAFQIGMESAALTHGGDNAVLCAGYYAMLLALILQGKELEEAALEAAASLKRYKNSEEAYVEITKAIGLAKEHIPEDDAIAMLGEGRAAAETMAMGLYAALKHENDFRAGVFFAANAPKNVKNGVAAVCGGILGAYLGSIEIPFDLIENLEMDDLLEIAADRVLDAVEGQE